MGMWKFLGDKLSSTEEGPKTEKASQKAARPANKLSKPKTNSTGNLLNVSSANTSRKNSATNLNDALPRRSSSVPARQDGGDYFKNAGRPHTQEHRPSYMENNAPDRTEMGRGRPVQRDGKEKKGRLSGFFRSKSTQAVPPEKKPPYHNVVKEQLGYSPTQQEYEAHRRDHEERERMKRFSMGRGSGGFTIQPNSNVIKRSSSYAPYPENRLSLVPEAPTPLATPGPDLQHIADTEAILTGQSVLVSRRQSMISTTSSYRRESRANSIISDASDHPMPPPMRRRSLMTPGVATRTDSSGRPRQRLQKQPPPARRMSANTPSTNNSSSGIFSKVRRTQTLPSEREDQRYYDSSAPPHPTPEQLLHMLQPLEKPTFRRSIEQQRVQTPNDLGHIGSFKLGSLRIVNGHASPGGTPRRAETAHEVDYFHLQGAGVTAQTQQKLQSLAARPKEPVELPAETADQKQRPTTRSSAFSFEQTRSPTNSQSNAANNWEAGALAAKKVQNGTAHTVEHARPGPSPNEPSAHQATRGSAFSFEQARPIMDSQANGSSAPQKPRVMTAFELAEMYRSEIDDFVSPVSPMSSQPHQNSSNIVSYTPPVETPDMLELSQETSFGNGRRQGDELFLPGDQIAQSTHQPEEGLPSPDPLAHRESIGTAYGQEYKALGPREVYDQARTVSYTAIQKPTVSHLGPMSLEKKDSGYSSHASLKSLKSGESKNDGWPSHIDPRNFKPSKRVASPEPKQETEITAYPVFIDNRARMDTLMAELPAEPRAPAIPAKDERPQSESWRNQRPQELASNDERHGGSTQEPSTNAPEPIYIDLGMDTLALTLSPPDLPKPFDLNAKRTVDDSDLIAVPYAATRARERPSLVETTRRRTTANVLQKATGRPPLTTRPSTRSGQPKHARSTSQDSIASIRRVISRGSRRNSSDIAEKMTVQKVDVVMSDIPAVPRRLSTTLMERANKRVSGFAVGLRKSQSREALEASQNQTEEKEKKEKKEKSVADPPPLDVLQKSLRRKSVPASTPTDRAIALSAFMPLDKTTNNKSDQNADTHSIHSSTSHSSKKSDKQIRKEFEQEITNLDSISSSLGSSPYDVARLSSSAPTTFVPSSIPSSLPVAPMNIPPKSADRGRIQTQRDQSGRIVGMDEEEASRFARNRSQIRAVEAERRDALLSLQGQRLPGKSNSNFANELAAQASEGPAKRRPVSESGVPPVPVLTPQELARQAGRGKRASTSGSIGPPVSALKDFRKQNDRKSRSGRSSHMFGRRNLSTQIEMPERLAPLPPHLADADGDLSGTSADTSASETESPATEPHITEPESVTTSVSSTSTARGEKTEAEDTLSTLVDMTPANLQYSSPLGNIPGSYPESISSNSSSGRDTLPRPPNVFGSSPPTGQRISAIPGVYTSPSFPITPTRPFLQSAMSGSRSHSSPGSSVSGSSGGISGSPLKKVAISAAPPVVMGPSRNWVGPTAKELAEMAVASKRAVGAAGGVRSNSALAGEVKEKREEAERPSSERGFRPEEKRRWGSRLRSEV